MNTKTLVFIACVFFVVILQSSQGAVTESGKIWLCGSSLHKKVSEICDYGSREATLYIRLARLSQKYGGIFEKRLQQYSRKLAKMHHNKHQRIKKRGIYSDCCLSACTYEHIQKTYCILPAGYYNHKKSQ